MCAKLWPAGRPSGALSQTGPEILATIRDGSLHECLRTQWGVPAGNKHEGYTVQHANLARWAACCIFVRSSVTLW